MGTALEETELAEVPDVAVPEVLDGTSVLLVEVADSVGVMVGRLVTSDEVGRSVVEEIAEVDEFAKT